MRRHRSVAIIRTRTAASDRSIDACPCARPPVVPRLVTPSSSLLSQHWLPSPARQRLRAKPYTVYNVTLTPYRIDFAANETRVFLRIKNATDYTIHYNVAQSYLLNDGIRIRPHPHRSYPQMPADLFPGSAATGVTTFRATTPGTVFKFVTRFSSDDIKVGNVGVTTPIIWTWTF